MNNDVMTNVTRYRESWLTHWPYHSLDLLALEDLLRTGEAGSTPATLKWKFTAPADFAIGQRERAADLVELAAFEYGCLAADLRAAQLLNRLRAHDVLIGWFLVTGGLDLGSLTGLGVARSLFEYAVEGARIAGDIKNAVTTCAERPKLAFIDNSVWASISRHLDGERSVKAVHHMKTRNVMANLDWLRTSVTTTHVAAAYDDVSDRLHGRTRSISQVASSEIMLVQAAVGLSHYTQSNFHHAADQLTSLIGPDLAHRAARGFAVVSVGGQRDPGLLGDAAAVTSRQGGQPHIWSRNP